MKQLKKFISSKGGFLAMLGTLLLLFLAIFLIVIGNVYGSYNGDWSKIGEILTQPYAITIYVVAGLLAFFLFVISVIFNMNKEI